MNFRTTMLPYRLARQRAAICTALIAALTFGTAAFAQACKSRGDLDPLYCDANGDMTADAPSDPQRWKNPKALLLSYSPQEDPPTYEKMWAPYIDHMKTCTGRSVGFLQVHSSAATVEAMRSGRIQFTLLSAGDTPFAVNVAGAVPFAIHGNENGVITAYHLIVVVKQNSPIKKLSDLAGKRVAHVSASSNSGNLAPRALFPAEGVIPDKHYKVLYSGKHDNSITGVINGDYDAAAVADDVLIRMIQRGVVKAADLRTIYMSRPFPAGSLSVAHDLDPALRKSIEQCTFSFRFPAELSTAFRGPDRFVPLSYKKDFESVRQVAIASGAMTSRTTANDTTPQSNPSAKK